MMRDAVAHFLNPYLTEPRRVWLALSGGVDSMVLLDLCTQISNPHLTLNPVHINHGVNPRADEWRQQCEATVARYGLTLTVVALDLYFPRGDSKEAIMRDARYHALAALMQPNDLLLTAHHADDQAETLFLQLLRGAGIAGLAAMPAESVFSPGFLLRPLLSFSKTELIAYANKQQLSWIEDDSNQDTQFDRNFLRQHILPQLKTRWPSVTTTLARTSKHCSEAVGLLDGMAEKALTGAQAGLAKHCLSLPSLLAADNVQQRYILRAWFKQNQLIMPSEKKLAHILSDVVRARPDAMPCVTWLGGKKGQRDVVSVRRYRDTLYLQAEKPLTPVSRALTWDLTASLDLPHDLGSLQAVAAETGLNLVQLQMNPIRVCFRTHVSHSLKKIWQQTGVPPWLRDQVPLIYSGEQLVAVPNYWVNKAFSATPGVLIEWHR